MTARIALDLEPAASLPLDRLATVFNEGFEQYLVPIRVDADGLDVMVRSLDLDLDRSRVAFVDGDPVGLVLLGIRDDEGWIGGMGVRPADRRRGIGRALMDAAVDEARARGLRRLRLEVIDANEAAVRLYRSLGFRRLRDVEVWTLDADHQAGAGTDLPVEDALTTIRSLRAAPEPWQRADGTVARLLELGRPLRAFAADGGAIVFRLSGTAATVVQIGAPDVTTTASLLRSVRAEGSSLHALNVPAGDDASTALRELGGRVDFRQHELALEL